MFGLICQNTASDPFCFGEAAALKQRRCAIEKRHDIILPAARIGLKTCHSAGRSHTQRYITYFFFRFPPAKTRAPYAAAMADYQGAILTAGPDKYVRQLLRFAMASKSEPRRVMPPGLWCSLPRSADRGHG